MPYTVKIDAQHRLVEVVYSGDITIATRVCAMEEGARLLATHQYTRALVDLRAAVAATESLDVGNSFATRIAHQPTVRGSGLAYVTLPTQHSNLLVENMAAARHVQLRRFHQRDEALHWSLLDP